MNLTTDVLGGEIAPQHPLSLKDVSDCTQAGMSEIINHGYSLYFRKY